MNSLLFKLCKNSLKKEPGEMEIISHYSYKFILRQEGRGQGTTIKRMIQPLRTGYDINWLEPTRPKMAEDSTSRRP